MSRVLVIVVLAVALHMICMIVISMMSVQGGTVSRELLMGVLELQSSRYQCCMM